MNAGPSEEQGGGGDESPRSRRWLLGLAKVAATVLVTWFILRQVGVSWAELAALDFAAWRPAWSLLVLSAVVLVTGLVLHALFWGRITAAFAGVPVAAAPAVRIHFTANLFRYVPGKVWQLAGLAMLVQRRGVPVRPALAAAVVSQVLNLLGATLVGAWILAARPGIPGAWGLGAVGALVAMGVLACVPAVQRWGVGIVFRLARREPPEWPVDPTFGLRWIVLHAVVWVLVALAFWIMVRSFGVASAPLEVGPAYAAAYVLGYLAIFAPAGLGVREGLLVAFLAPTTGPAAAVALSVIARFWSTVAELVPAAIFALLELRRPTISGGEARPEPGG